jgi:hypothetical protein
MSVGPVQPGSAEVEPQTPEKKVRAAPTPTPARSGNSPKAETAETPNSPTPFSTPEHEVKVQSDTPPDELMIYQVLDKKSGVLVLQVPSAEVLSGIHQTQEQQRIAAKGKASVAAAAIKEEEKKHGNKL